MPPPSPDERIAPLAFTAPAPVSVARQSVPERFVASWPWTLPAFILVAALWGIAFNGFPYAIALKTGNPSAVGASFILYFPFAFLTTAYVPQEALSGWLAFVAQFNPVTYLLAALRSLISVGWDASALGAGLGATAIVAAISLSLALLALRGRVSNG